MEEYWYRRGKIFGRLAFYTWVDVLLLLPCLVNHVKRSDLDLSEPTAKMKYGVKDLMLQNITVTVLTG